VTWLMWRQHRLQWAIAAGVIALFAIPTVVTGRNLASAFALCRANGPCDGGQLFNHYNAINTLIDLTVAVPVVFGLFWGATLLGRELENGTAALVWTQSVTRRRWLWTKITALLLSAALAGAAVSALVTWWSNTHNATVESRFAGLQFDIQGVVPVAYSVFAAALGLAAGAFWRRALPAMATTLAGFFAVRLLVELYLRSHFLAPVVSTRPLARGPGGPAGAWVQGTDVVRHGKVITGPIQLPACAATGTRDAANRCLDAAGYRMRTTYQPAGRYWSFQWIEAGIFLALAALLVATAVILLRRRDA
jgi:hypothetical protein